MPETIHRPPSLPGTQPPGRLVLTILLCVVLAGCRAKGKWSEADELRSQLDTMSRQVQALTAERDEARAKLAEAELVRLGGSDLAREAADALPRCAGIEIDRLSGPDRDGSAVDIYLKPFDGRRRFIQIVGTVNVRVDGLPAPSSPGADPSTLTTATFGPSDLREAYRSSVLGTHYALHLQLKNPPAPGENLAVSVEFIDALSGGIHTAERVIRTGSR